jgi:hypothetical protein
MHKHLMRMYVLTLDLLMLLLFLAAPTTTEQSVKKPETGLLRRELKSSQVVILPARRLSKNNVGNARV